MEKENFQKREDFDIEDHGTTLQCYSCGGVPDIEQWIWTSRMRCHRYYACLKHRFNAAELIPKNRVGMDSGWRNIQR